MEKETFLDFEPKNETSFERVSRITELSPCQCSCKECREICKRMCLGTPDDILHLMAAGYKSLLMPGCAVVIHNHEPRRIEMVQLRADEEGCVMFRQGRCLLHGTGLKPTGGLLYHHSLVHNDMVDGLLILTIAMEWLRVDNEEKVARCLEAFGLNSN